MRKFVQNYLAFFSAKSAVSGNLLLAGGGIRI